MGDIAITVEHVTKSFKIYQGEVPVGQGTPDPGRPQPHEVFQGLARTCRSTCKQGRPSPRRPRTARASPPCSSAWPAPSAAQRRTHRGQGPPGRPAGAGAGFPTPTLTGQENIYLNGKLDPGVLRTQIDRIFDDIVAFAELEEFTVANQVDLVGHAARLGLRGRHQRGTRKVLLVDEVLAVSDERFSGKSIERCEEAQANGRTLLLVSHAADLVRQLAEPRHRAGPAAGRGGRAG